MKNGGPAGIVPVAPVDVERVLGDEGGRVRRSREPIDTARPDRAPDVIGCGDEVEHAAGCAVHQRRGIDLEPAVVVLLDGEQDRMQPRRLEQPVGAPLSHDPRGERGMIGLRDQLLRRSVEPNDHRLTIMQGVEAT